MSKIQLNDFFSRLSDKLVAVLVTVASFFYAIVLVIKGEPEND